MFTTFRMNTMLHQTLPAAEYLTTYPPISGKLAAVVGVLLLLSREELRFEAVDVEEGLRRVHCERLQPAPGGWRASSVFVGDWARACLDREAKPARAG